MQVKLNIKKTMFNDVYFPMLFNYEHRYEIYYGGAGSGKSVFLAQKILIKALNSKRKVLIIRKVGTTIKDSVFQLILDTLSKFRVLPFCKVNLSTYTIALPNGSIILFKGLDDSEKIKSITDITDIWCEEATELTETDFDQLDLRLRALAKYLQIFVSFNPVSKANFVYKRWFAEDAVIDQDTVITQTTYKDNRFLPESYVKSLEDKAKTNPTYYKIYALGEFCSLDKLVYNNWKVREFDNKDIVGDLLLGLDFGFVNDISALVAAVLVEESKKIYIFNSWGDTNKTNKELADIIKSLGFGKSVIICDSAEPKSIEELRRNGVTRARACFKGKDSIIHGIQELQNYEIVIHPRCEDVITEFENYTWKKDKSTNEYINEPIDKFNHYLDALRYSLQCVRQDRKLKTINKGLLSL